MNRMIRPIALFASMPFFAACFHATVYTGIPGAGETISKPWAPSYLAGLIAPSIVEPASKCKAGVYSIETLHSPGNVLVSIASLGIYTPLRIDVTCARELRLSAGSRLEPSRSSAIAQ